jgi:hypothetical protein
MAYKYYGKIVMVFIRYFLERSLQANQEIILVRERNPYYGWTISVK